MPLWDARDRKRESADEHLRGAPSCPLDRTRAIGHHAFCVIELETFVWLDTGRRSEVRIDPSPADIATAIGQLDGGERNDLYLRADSGRWMGVAGGPDLLLVSYSESEEGPHWQAVSTVDSQAPRGAADHRRTARRDTSTRTRDPTRCDHRRARVQSVRAAHLGAHLGAHIGAPELPFGAGRRVPTAGATDALRDRTGASNRQNG